MTAEPPAAPAASSPQEGVRRAKLRTLRGRLSVFAVAAAITALALAAVAVVGVRQGWLTYAGGRGVIFGLAAPACALLAVVLGALTLVFAVAVAPRAGFKRAAFAVLAGGLTFWGVAQANGERQIAPPVHEVATDWRDPIMPSPALLAARGPDANPLEAAPAVPEGPRTGVLGRPVAQVNAETCKAAVPATLMATPQDAYAKAKAALLAEKLALVTDDPSQGRLEATAERGLFAVKDDVMVRVRGEGAGARIDIRSSARVGATDGGENCRRLEKLRAAMAG